MKNNCMEREQQMKITFEVMKLDGYDDDDVVTVAKLDTEHDAETDIFNRVPPKDLMGTAPRYYIRKVYQPGE